MEITAEEMERLRKSSILEDRLLEIIDNRDLFTRSDLQGAVSAFVRGYCDLDRV